MNHEIRWNQNNSGVVVGPTLNQVSRNIHAFRWTPVTPHGTTGNMIDLGFVGAENSLANAINNSGQVAGLSDSPQKAVLWDNSNGIHVLGTLPNFPQSSIAYAINDVGQVVGSSTSSSGVEEAFLWTPATPNGTSGTMTDLGTLPGLSYSQARGINSAGTVVGYAYDIPTGVFRAFVIIGDVMYDLNDLIPPDSGITLTQAVGINQTGQILATGAAAAWLLTPSAPVDSTGPVTSNVSAAPNPVAVNTAMTLTATVDDTATGGSIITSADYTLDGVSHVVMSATDGAFNAVRENVKATLPAFTAAGVLKVCVAGTDAVGNTGSPECILLAVYDPTAGFVTGGGWITSPPGAYTPNPQLTGKANFGFVSKYQKGANTPTGETEFQFNVASLNFHSDTYEWLVVAGARAQFKGTGTINNSGTYGFLLTAIDGQISGGGGVDKFRIKIWDTTTDGIVYDNKLGASDTGNDATELGGGSIVIHAQ
jgi:probable HAF family extracellular repeat protein